jgi:hypothetical protein
MRSEKAWYWLAAGVVTLGLNGAYQDGQLGWAHCLAGQATAYVQRVAERGMQYVAMAEVMVGGSPEALDRTEAALQKVQSKVVCQRVAMAQREMAKAQARQQIAEAKMRQKFDLMQMKMGKVRMISSWKADQFRNCPGFAKVVVDMPDLPNVNIDMSNLQGIEIPDIPEIPQAPETGTRGPI